MVSLNNRLLATAGLLAFLSGQPVFAIDLADNQPTVLKGGIEVDDAANQIAHKEVELLKLNTKFKLEQIPDKWAGRRWFADNLALCSLVSTGSYANASERWRFQNHTTHISKYFFAKTGWTRMIGSWIIVGGAAMESTALAYRHHKQFERGVDPESMRKYAVGLQKNIDDLLKQRDVAIAASGASGVEKQAYDQEGQVLKDVRDLEVNEFSRFYTGAKGSTVGTYTGYLIAGVNNGLIAAGAITGNAFGLKIHGTTRQRNRDAGGGAICEMIAGSINMTVPFTTRAIAFGAKELAHRSLCKQLDCAEPGHLDKLHTDELALHTLISANTDLASHGFVSRDSIFAKQAAIFDHHEVMRLGEKHADRIKLLNQLVFFESVGATKLTNGITAATAQFKYAKNPRLRFKTLAPGFETQGVGYTVAGGDLLTNQLWGELERHKAAAEHRTLGAVLRQQIDDLTALGGKG